MGFSVWNQSFQDWWPQGRIMFQFLIAVWIIGAINGALGGNLSRHGLKPREWVGLFGIFYMPFLHKDWDHLWGNTVGYIVFSAFILANNPADLPVVTLSVMILGGLGVWLFGGSRTNHIGASGVVFGYIGFCLALAYVFKTPVTAMISIATIFFYSNRVWLLFPIRKGMSWEGHMFGFASGIATALYLPQFRSIYQGVLPILVSISNFVLPPSIP
jgi:membrane associated rhomboid family serine protease